MFSEATLAAVGGRLEEALAVGERLSERGEELGMPVYGRAWANIVTIRPLLHLGRAEEALEVLPQAAQMARAEFEGSGTLSRKALVLAHLDRQAEALEIIRQLLNDMELDQASVYIFVTLLEAAILVQDKELAQILATPLSVAAHLARSGFANTNPARHLGAAETLLGAPKMARGYYHQALEACAKIGFRPDIALTRLQLAELILEHYADERPEAMEHLDFAIGEFRDMKMQPSLERALRHREILRA